jgi:hypothetical protein
MTPESVTVLLLAVAAWYGAIVVYVAWIGRP